MTLADWVLFGSGCVCMLAVVALLLYLGHREAEEVVNGAGDGLDRLLDGLTMLFVGGSLAIAVGVVAIIQFIVGPGGIATPPFCCSSWPLLQPLRPYRRASAEF